MTLYNQKDKNICLTWFYLIGFLVFVIVVGWVFSQALGNSSILYGAIVFAVFMNFISYWWSDKIVLAMNGAKRIDRKNNREIYNLVENLCIIAGLPVPNIYIIGDASPNAFATGRNPEHAVIALTTGLIKILDRSELEGVIAHELSHIGNRDILLGTVVTVLVGFIAILADWFFRMSIFGRLGGDDNKSSQIQLIFTLMAIVLAILAPIGAMLMQMAISRKREYLADADGALLTRYPEGLARALEKLSQSPVNLKRTNKSMAHMYIVNPLKGKKAKGFVTKLFMTHPPIEERIIKLKGMAK
ncbi:MAG: M48 family metallopeptidase [Candidatus Moranbacteria bacterium]|nr:M48 family metallopeptidase [Candidatus Moranbacteria bacterium]